MTLQEKQERASSLREAGYNCCQSVYLAVTEQDETAAGIGYCFGGGMQCGSVCGALTGGLMALGESLRGSTPAENRPVAKSAAVELEHAFEKAFDSMNCSDILAANGKKICGDCVAFCVKNAAEIIEKINKGEL